MEGTVLMGTLFASPRDGAACRKTSAEQVQLLNISQIYTHSAIILNAELCLPDLAIPWPGSSQARYLKATTALR